MRAAAAKYVGRAKSLSSGSAARWIEAGGGDGEAGRGVAGYKSGLGECGRRRRIVVVIGLEDEEGERSLLAEGVVAGAGRHHIAKGVTALGAGLDTGHWTLGKRHLLAIPKASFLPRTPGWCPTRQRPSIIPRRPGWQMRCIVYSPPRLRFPSDGVSYYDRRQLPIHHRLPSSAAWMIRNSFFLTPAKLAPFFVLYNQAWLRSPSLDAEPATNNNSSCHADFAQVLY